ncbi:MAG: NAD(P)H-binding protein [Chitinophagaceae bacterium]
MQVQSAVVIGASGLIGSNLLHLLLQNKQISNVTALVRKPLQVKHSKLRCLVVDFNNIDDFKTKLGAAQLLFCCIGTTMKQVGGNKDLYRSIDYHIPVTAAQLAKEAGFQHFCLVSSVGADSMSSNFYLQLKGEVEQTLKQINLPHLTLLQPSLLLGNRSEKRLGEKMAQLLAPVFNLFLWGNWQKYKPIKAEKVAKAMLFAALNKHEKLAVWQYPQIVAAANQA